MERLQKVMARAGVASRRHCEKMITSGMVKVNGKVVTNLGSKVDPARDKIQVGGETVFLASRRVYILMYKPRGYITTLNDEKGRKKVTDFLKHVTERVYPVGRLDYDSEGLLLLTNDGALTYALTHPRHQIPKTYLVRVKGVPSQKMLHKLTNSMVLEDGPVTPAVVILLNDEKNALLEITVYEGRNRLVRRMCDSIGHPVLRLKRIKIANLSIKGLRPGRYRHLTGDEVKSLKQLAGLEP
ncbi:MAG: Pseudouridine synthase [Pelotomaculum thermopropionicum]|uniref:Pseudouridine synthase n=1 Tax=Pelotomaculum thermopropionicum TaxID=110500 RepID=A0A101HQ94_9FIRM|nr:MAG: Pseudouridine synthase [Pelotomaculum thermopropionicum]